MLLKYIDNMLEEGKIDLEKGKDEEVDVSFVELSRIETEEGQNPKAVWKEAFDTDIKRKYLFYDSTDDGSKKYINSWKDFYKDSGTIDGGKSPIWGSNSLMRNGAPMLGGVTKTSIYLRYSKGYMDWLESKDSEAADALAQEIPVFERLIENSKTKKLLQNWLKRPDVDSKWVLPVVSRLSDGKAIVLGFKPDITSEDISELEEELSDNINVKLSVELSSYLRTPEKSGFEIVDGELHARSGMGRNAFGKEPKLDEITNTEYERLLGPLLNNEPNKIREVWTEINNIAYRVRTTPTPDNSFLIFFPEGNLNFSIVKKVVNYEKEKKKIYWESRKSNSNSAIGDITEEIPSVIANIPNYVPAVDSTTVFLTSVEGGQKKKRNIMGIFHSVRLAYWQLLNSELLESGLEWKLLRFTSASVTGAERLQHPPPSIFQLWTETFTKALQMQFITALPVWNRLQSFFKAFTTSELVDDRKGQNYLYLLTSLKRMQHLIGECRKSFSQSHEGNEAVLPDMIELPREMKLIEEAKLMKYAVMDKESSMDAKSGKELLGEFYDALWEYQRRKIDEFIKRSWQGSPDKEYSLFIKGAIVGMLLSELQFQIRDKAEKRFEATQGRHPTAMRGEIITQVFSKGLGLLQNSGKETSFNSQTLPFIVSWVPDSHTTAFNNGFVMGLSYIPSKRDKNQEVEE